MVSIESVIEKLHELGTSILIIMQEADTEEGWDNLEWASAMYDAHEKVRLAEAALAHAQSL